MEIKNAVIESVTLEKGDRGFLQCWLHLSYGGSGQGFGGYVLYLPKSFAHHSMQSVAGHFMFRCMEVAGVDNWADMAGRTIRVRADNGKVYAIGHIVKDDWFDPAEDFSARSDADEESEALRDMLGSARSDLDVMRNALGVPVEPHQSLLERMVEAAQAKRGAVPVYCTPTEHEGRIVYEHTSEPIPNADGFVLYAAAPAPADDASLSTCQARLFDVLVGDDGQAWAEAERYLETARPDLFATLRREAKPAKCDGNHGGPRCADLADREAHGTVNRGQANGNADLTEDQVRGVRRRAAAGESQRSIANSLGIQQSTVSKIVRRERWGWVK